LAHEYGFVCDKFYDGLSPETKIMTDHHILNCLITEENEANQRQREEAERERRMPGVKRMVTASERSEQLAAMRRGED